MTYIDHLGNHFESMAEMARFHNIPSSTLDRRINTQKLDIKTALTITPEECKYLRLQCEDHLGNKFRSKKEMCEHYGIPRQIFFGRISIGWSLEEALTTPIVKQAKNSHVVTDHTGVTWPSISEMCRHWGIKQNTYRARIKSGWSIKDALLKPQQIEKITATECIDHLGNKYKSLNEMCKTYGLDHTTYSTRVNKLGWSKEKALTEKKIINSIEIEDIYGNKFPSYKDLGNFYCIPEYFFQGKNIKNLQKILETKFLKYIQLDDIMIKDIIEFPYYLAERDGCEFIITHSDIFDRYHNSKYFNPLPKSKIKDKNLEVISIINFPYYKIKFQDNIETWSYWDLIKYRHDSNFGLSAMKGCE